MRSGSARNAICLLWLAFFLPAVGGLLWFYGRDGISDDNLHRVLSQLNQCYSPYLGAILAFYLGLPMVKPGPKRIGRNAFAAALVSTLGWNLITVYFLWQLILMKTSVDSATANMAQYSSMFNWVLAPAMGYFFASHATAGSGEDHDAGAS